MLTSNVFIGIFLSHFLCDLGWCAGDGAVVSLEDDGVRLHLAAFIVHQAHIILPGFHLDWLMLVMVVLGIRLQEDVETV